MLVLQKLAYGPAFIGIVTNWDNIEKIIKESFKTLGVDPKDTPVLITESAQNVNANREKWIQLFESFEIQSFYRCLTTLSFISSNRSRYRNGTLR